LHRLLGIHLQFILLYFHENISKFKVVFTVLLIDFRFQQLFKYFRQIKWKGTNEIFMMPKLYFREIARIADLIRHLASLKAYCLAYYHGWNARLKKHSNNKICSIKNQTNPLEHLLLLRLWQNNEKFHTTSILSHRFQKLTNLKCDYYWIGDDSLATDLRKSSEVFLKVLTILTIRRIWHPNKNR
jgi:hypothetical protein